MRSKEFLRFYEVLTQLVISTNLYSIEKINKRKRKWLFRLRLFKLYS